jgi:small GTP-binding protein
MIYKKVCMLGAPAVGKTSLTQRFVNGVFDERYLMTIGAKIDARTISTSAGDVQLMIWDLNGDEMFERVQASYMRGMHGYLLVFDPTRPETLEFALKLRPVVENTVGQVPSILVCSKADLRDQWQVLEPQIQALQDSGWTITTSSAKTGAGTEETFADLATRMLQATMK